MCVWNHQWQTCLHCYEDCEDHEDLTSTIIDECFTLCLTIAPNSQIHTRTHADSPPYFLSLLPFVTFSCMESIQLSEIYPLGVTSRWPQRHCILLLLSVVTAWMSDSKSNQLLSESPVHSVSHANQILGGWRHRWLKFGCKGKPWMRFFFSFIYNVIY